MREFRLTEPLGLSKQEDNYVLKYIFTNQGQQSKPVSEPNEAILKKSSELGGQLLPFSWYL